jgi:hypothetical protein
MENAGFSSPAAQSKLEMTESLVETQLSARAVTAGHLRVWVKERFRKRLADAAQ